ncbi:hypothetical protein RZS08_22975, partial [Arthrospira platensis SPKY1]|nr:hypothetical protein [Arthrospira platensis SPKY1]
GVPAAPQASKNHHELWQAFDQPANSHHLRPVAASQQALQAIPAAVFQEFVRIAQHLDEAVELTPAGFPVRREGLDHTVLGFRQARATVVIIDYEIAVKQQALQQHVGNGFGAGTVAHQAERIDACQQATSQ